jgi:hypothetical protein
MRVFRIGFVVCLAAAVLGCSRTGKTSVTGTITYKGEPVKAGTVYFYYEQGGQYQCDLKPDGSYQFIDVPAGNVKVVVDNGAWDPEQRPVPYTLQGRDVGKGYNKTLGEYDARMGRGWATDKKVAAPAGQPLSKEKKEELAKVYVKVPKKYADEKATPLTYTVERGRQVKDFDLAD